MEFLRQVVNILKPGYRTPEEQKAIRQYRSDKLMYIEQAYAGMFPSVLTIKPEVGNPLFDALPEVIRFSPENRVYVFTFRMSPDWEKDEELKKKLDNLEKVAKKSERTRLVFETDE